MKKETKAIVVGASSGIGLEVARLLLKKGCRVGIAARREERLKALQAEWPGRVEVERIDVTDEEAPRQLRQLTDRLGGIDLFVYASGIGKQNPKLEEDIELQTMQTNALGFTRMVGEAYRLFAERGCGHIAAITSIAGTKGLGPAPAYSATKAMQNTYLQALEQQARGRRLHICFTDIRPGFVDTDLLSGDYRYPMMLRPEAVARKIVQAIERRRHVVVIDWRYRWLTALWRRCPRWVWRHLPIYRYH